MSMSDVKAAFVTTLGGAGTCTDASMSYVPESRSLQRLTFTVAAAGETHFLTEDVPPGVDLAGKAREMAAAFVASIGD